MKTDLEVVLHADGTFSAQGPHGRFHLQFDGEDDRWLIAGPLRGAEAPLVAMAGQLDEALRILLAATGSLGQFVVALPCGRAFQRPGRVPAAEILSAFGYAIVRAVKGSVIVKAPLWETSMDVVSGLARALSERPVEVGEADLVEGVGSVNYWCCAVSVPFEGPIQTRRALALLDEALDGADVEVVEEVELDAPRAVAPNEAQVVAFRALTQAA